jgi:hypothetical protein
MPMPGNLGRHFFLINQGANRQLRECELPFNWAIAEVSIITKDRLIKFRPEAPGTKPDASFGTRTNDHAFSSAPRRRGPH